MIKNFARKIEYEVPELLQDLIVGFILGKTKKEVNEIIPMYPCGYSTLFNIFGVKPYLSINGQRQQTESRLIIAGQICNANINFHIDGIFGQIGIVLYPTANYYLFHKTGDKFLNTWCSLQESSPLDTQELIQNLAMENSIQGRLLHIIDFLILLEKQRLPAICWLEDSLVKIFVKNGNVSQHELVEDSNLTARHYRRIFKKVIGVSPKYYCKVIQLATVFELLNNSEEEKLHHLALDCGYYDQSHFIHDFQKLIGNSPENFLNGEYSYLKTYMGRRGIGN
ncbi:MAG: helix-turn-helix domain-containing protein [Bacteroidota bacterium]